MYQRQLTRRFKNAKVQNRLADVIEAMLESKKRLFKWEYEIIQAICDGVFERVVKPELNIPEEFRSEKAQEWNRLYWMCKNHSNHN